MPLTQLLYGFFVLCAIFMGLQCKCTTTFITTCEKVSDIPRYGKQTWTNLIIANDQCKDANPKPPDEVLRFRAFDKTRNLEELYIAEKLTEIKPGAFDGLEQLTYLKLYKNLIKVIPRGAFSNLTQVFKMDLQDNFIENIQHGLFANATIAYINLSNNKINNIQVDQLSIPSLKKLRITNNDISLLVPDCFHENLEYLNLDHNSLDDINAGVLKPLKKLKTLILSHNKFQGLGITDDYGLTSLEKLDFSHNQIVDIKSGSFNEMLELKYLHLDYNNITYLPPDIFPDENSIKVLYLHHNGLTNLDAQVGRKLHNLKEISLGANPWACACLWEIISYINGKGVNQPDCDKDYFSSGISAICVMTGDSCVGEEHLHLTREIYNTFIESLKDFKC